MNYKESIKNIKSKSKAIKKDKSKVLSVLLIVFVFLYIVFITSKLWMPKSYTGIDVSSIGESFELREKTITLDAWQYSKEEKAMQIMLELEDMSIDGEELNIVLKDLNNKEYKLTNIVDENDLIVLQSNIRNSWSELILTVSVGDEENADMLQFTMNYKKCEMVDKIKNTDKNSYYKMAYESKIDGYEKEIEALKKEKKDIQMQEDNAEEKIKDLEKSMEFQTKEQQQETKTSIIQIETKLDDLEKEYEDKSSEIQEFYEKISLTKDKIDALDKGDDKDGKSNKQRANKKN